MISKYARLPLRENLHTVYAQVEPIDIELGERWYPQANRIVAEWAETYGLTESTVACVIAAISPQCSWERNLIIADEVLTSYAMPISIKGALRKNIEHARNIVRLRHTSIYAVFKSAPKVASFAQNLQGNYRAVTVDTHCVQAAMNDVTATVSLHEKQYAAFADAYAEVARDVNYPPAIFQAIVWHIWKRRYPAIRKRNLRRQWDAIGEF